MRTLLRSFVWMSLLLSGGALAQSAQMLKDLNGGIDVGLSSPTMVGDSVAKLPNGFVFIACTRLEGCEPWFSDGTAQGTTLLRDVFPGPGSALYSYSQLFTVGGRVFFGASDGSTGMEPWVTDGTNAGTHRVK